MPQPSSSLKFTGDSIVLEYSAPGFGKPRQGLFVALGFEETGGSALLPFARDREGSTVIAPTPAHRLYSAWVAAGGPTRSWQEWKKTRWSGPMDVKPEFTADVFPGRMRVTINLNALPAGLRHLRVTAWAKDLNANGGWGELLPDAALRTRGGTGDHALDWYYAVDLTTQTARVVSRRHRLGGRMRIYQLLPRLFSNTNETRKLDGTLAENGAGKFDEITDAALRSIANMGFSHLWLTGVLNQATATDYSSINLPPSDPALLKGKAGSPYAIRDYFDLCPDYATNSADRLAEFKSLLVRAHTAGLKVLIDFVPNHVARCYASTIKPELSFGVADNPLKFFDPANNFFWLQPDSPGGGPPLRLPGVDGVSRIYEPERTYGRVTGNNACTWSPSLRNDWYETVKLNYGFDFTTGTRAHPHAENPDMPIPDTWKKIDTVLAYWQGLGVDGFRCDMAHMVPPEFWAWALARARERNAHVCFIAEAYNDLMKVTAGDVMPALLCSGFDAVYDDPTYKLLKAIYEDGKWANDIDGVLGPGEREYVFRNALRYAENHDEVRLASKGNWGGIGPNVGRAVSAILYGVGCGPVLLYSGQEVGEPAHDRAGFGGDHGRTTIFDYWSMPEFTKWVNNHHYDAGRLSAEQQSLRAYYGRLVTLVGEPAFRDGGFHGLNDANRYNTRFGRLPGETVSGHWIHTFLRSDPESGQRFLCVVNLHATETFRDLHIHLPANAISFMGLTAESKIGFIERLAESNPLTLPARSLSDGVSVPALPPLTAFFLEFQPTVH